MMSSEKSDSTECISLSQLNSNLNPDTQASVDDHELEYLDALNSFDGLSSGVMPSFKARLKYRKEDTYKKDSNDGSLCFERKAVKSELETVIRWENIKVEVLVKDAKKMILSDVCGEINNLDIMCILGPSGAGKYTLLNTIAGRIKNYTGSVRFYSKDKRIAFAYVPQVDLLAEMLTVKESLLFASRAKNPPDTDHVKEVEFLLNSFNLFDIRNQYTLKCSGGERKRLSIGLEMISKPKILILDEPTSGLDSTTSYIVIEILKKISKNTTVITTIHQPNSRLFQLFDRCYILTEGKCIYNGTPRGIVDDLKNRFDIICPEFTNPADFIIGEILNLKINFFD